MTRCLQLITYSSQAPRCITYAGCSLTHTHVHTHKHRERQTHTHHSELGSCTHKSKTVGRRKRLVKKKENTLMEEKEG